MAPAYTYEEKLKNGMTVLIRPIQPEDESAMVHFHQRLSNKTVYYRYLQSLQLRQRISHARLERVCASNHDNEIALVALLHNEIRGVVRMCRFPGTSEAEMAIVIEDSWQRLGLGKALLRAHIDMARHEGVTRIIAEMAQDNVSMQRLAVSMGFVLERRLDDPIVTAVYEVPPLVSAKPT